MARGTVDFFDPEEGWGALSSPDLPPGKGAWVHFSEIMMDGYRNLDAGDRVEFDAVPVRQDGYEFRAERVRKV